MQYIDLTDIYCYKEKITQNICLHIKYITSCREHISSVKLTFIILYIKSKHTFIIHLFLIYVI